MVKENEKIRELAKQNEELKLQLAESQETLRAIQSGEVDALVVQSPSGDQVYTLKDAEHPYRVMVETMNEGAATLAADGTVFYCNHQLADLLKVPLEKLMVTPFTNFVAPADIPVFQSVLKQAASGISRAEIELKTPDGAIVPVLVSAGVLGEEQNQMVSLVVTDLSEQKRTAQIVASERFAQTILEQAADALIVCDIDGTIIRVSEKAHNILGTELQGLKFDQVFDHFYPASAGVSPLALEKTGRSINLDALKSGEIISDSEICLVVDGRVKQNFILNFSPLSEKGNILGYSISLTDITDREKAEEALLESESKFHGLFNTMSEGIALHEIIYDETGKAVDYRILDINPAYEQITALTREKTIGEKASELYGTGIPPYIDIYERVITGKPETFETYFPPMQKHFRISVFAPDKTHFVTVFSDITDIKKAEDASKRNSAELQEVNTELEAFSYSISHDLKAPLRGLSGFSKILLEDYAEKLDAEGKSYLNKIVESSEYMGHLIDDLLKLARITRSDLNYSTLNLSEMAQKITAELRSDEPKRKAEVLIEPGLIAYGDRVLLGQALENLLNNAWKYSRKKPETKIEMGSVEHEGKTAYFIKDNGAGFNMDYAQKLFKPFQRLHTTSEFEGTGIGLAIVQRIVRRHGGEVWAEGKQGEGATFYFTLG